MVLKYMDPHIISTRQLLKGGRPPPMRSSMSNTWSLSEFSSQSEISYPHGMWVQQTNQFLKIIYGYGFTRIAWDSTWHIILQLQLIATHLDFIDVFFNLFTTQFAVCHLIGTCGNKISPVCVCVFVIWIMTTYLLRVELTSLQVKRVYISWTNSWP